jgi:hypothetical protein
MTNFKTTIIATAFIALGALSVSSLTAKADVTGSLSQCRAFTAEKVIRCCDQIIRTQGRPFWMLENNASCQTSVSCVSSTPRKGRVAALVIAPKKRCSIAVKFNSNNGSPGSPGSSGRDKSPNGPNAAPVGVLR